MVAAGREFNAAASKAGESAGFEWFYKKYTGEDTGKETIEELRKKRQDPKSKPEGAQFGEFAMAMGTQAAAFDLLGGRDSVAGQLLLGGEMQDRFKGYVNDWRKKDEMLFDSEFQEQRRREMAWKDESFNRANYGNVQAMLSLAQSQNAQVKSAVLARLFGMRREYKFLRTNLVARMGFTGFSGIHAFLGAHKRTVKSHWKQGQQAPMVDINKPIRWKKERKERKGKKRAKDDSGMPDMGLKRQPQTKQLRRRLKNVARNAIAKGDWVAKSTANDMKRALKWGIVKPGNSAFNRIIQFAAGALGDEPPTHDELDRQALAAEELALPGTRG